MSKFKNIYALDSRLYVVSNAAEFNSALKSFAEACERGDRDVVEQCAASIGVYIDGMSYTGGSCRVINVNEFVNVCTSSLIDILRGGDPHDLSRLVWLIMLPYNSDAKSDVVYGYHAAFHKAIYMKNLDFAKWITTSAPEYIESDNACRMRFLAAFRDACVMQHLDCIDWIISIRDDISRADVAHLRVTDSLFETAIRFNYRVYCILNSRRLI